METITPAEQLKRVKVVFSVNLLICAFGFAGFINALNTGTTWRIVTSGIGFSIFIFLIIAVFLRLRKLQKTV